MAFPTLVAAPTITNFATSVTSMAVNYPASVTAGNKLILYVSVRNPGSWGTPPTGWTQKVQQTGGGSASQLTIFERTATGSEAGTVTFTASVGTTATWQMAQFSGADATTISVSSTSGDATGANSPSLTPPWGALDTTWLTIAGHAAASAAAFTAVPTNYTAATSPVSSGASSGGGAVSVAMGYRQLNASSEDPGAFTAGGSNRFWAAATVAIKPISGGGTTGHIKVKNSGTFAAKPVKVKIGGSFVTKTLKKKVGGTFTPTTY